MAPFSFGCMLCSLTAGVNGGDLHAARLVDIDQTGCQLLKQPKIAASVRGRHQAAILVARYRSLANVHFWPKPAIHQISMNARLRCQAAVGVPPKRAQMPSQSKLGMALFATARMYLAKVTSDLCPVCSRICHGCSPLIAACVQ